MTSVGLDRGNFPLYIECVQVHPNKYVKNYALGRLKMFSWKLCKQVLYLVYV